MAKDNLRILPTATKPQRSDLWKCRFLHTWSKWEDVRAGRVVNLDDIQVGWYVYQESRCLRCNKLRSRNEMSFMQTERPK